MAAANTIELFDDLNVSQGTFTTIADAVAAASAGYTIELGAGSFMLSGLLTVDESISIIGDSEGTTTVVAAAAAYGIHVTTDNVSISNLTLDASAVTHYGLKVNPTGGATALSGFDLQDVTVFGAGRSEIDLNGVHNSSLARVTANGDTGNGADGVGSTSGVGIALSDSTNIALEDITTLNNGWGSLGLYSAGNAFPPGGTNTITFTGSYNHGEAIGIYADEENGTSVDTIDFSGLGWTTVYKVENTNFRDGADGRSDDFTFFFGDEAEAVAFALAMEDATETSVADKSSITIDETPGDVDAETGTTFVVEAGMSIQAAVDAASAGDTILVGPGTYAEDVVIDKALTLLSTDGAGTTIIDGQGVGLGAITISASAGLVNVGDVGQGFTVLGNNGPAGLEKAGIYLQGAQDGITIRGNVVEARGDAALISEYSATVTNVTVDQNSFTGQTFVGPNPAGFGFSTQFSEDNVPRQLVTLGGNGQNTSNVTFTNNEVSGTAGGLNTSGQEQGNTLVTIDAADSTITGNDFTGFTNRYATALRAREDNTEISGNTFDAGTNDSPNTAAVYVDTPTPGVMDNNTFIAASGGQVLSGLGDDTFQGGAGSDTVVYNGNRADYTVTFTTDGGGAVTGYSAVVDDNPGDGDDGSDALSGIEVLQFADMSIDLSKAIQLYDAGGTLVGSFDTLADAVANAEANGKITVGAGTYTENVTIGASLAGLTIEGAFAGTAGSDGARDLMGGTDESTLEGRLVVLADGASVDGMRFAEGAAGSPFEFTTFHVQADNVSVSNSTFYRSGAVDGDLSRGVINSVGQGDGLSVTDNAFSGFHTGTYVNGINDVTVSGNDYTANLVGVSVDAYAGGDQNVAVTGNTFDNVLEDMGMGGVSGSLGGTSEISGNTFNKGFYDYDPADNSGLLSGNTFVPGAVTVSGSESVYTSIQEAIDAAPNGATITVGAGTFREQLLVDGKSDLTIIGAGDSTVIEMVDAPVFNHFAGVDGGSKDRAAVVTVRDADNFTLEDVLVDGRGLANAMSGNVAGSPDFEGVLMFDSSGSIEDVTVTGVRDPYSGGYVSGNQRGNAIVVLNEDGLARTVSIVDNTVADFQKSGILGNGDGLSFVVTGNTVTGAGYLPLPTAIAQNGIQVSFGASGYIDGNLIEEIGYARGDFVTAGILGYDPADGLTVVNNTFTGATDGSAAQATSHVPVYVITSDNATVSGNTFDGLVFGAVFASNVDNPTFDSNTFLNDFSEVTTNTGSMDTWTRSNVEVYGNANDEALTFTASPGEDVVLGTDFADAIDGGAGNDALDGGAANDTLTGGLGDDTISGGDGVDVAVVADAGGVAFDDADYDFSGLTATGGVVSGTLDGPDGTEELDGIEVIQIANTGSSTFYVIDGMSIQTAIDAASAGDTILVDDGTYAAISVDKALTIAAVNAGGALIEGPGVSQGAAVRIEAGVDGVGISGFDIDASTGDVAGIYAVGDNSSLYIADNDIDGGTANGFLSGSNGGFGLSDSVIQDNTITSTGPTQTIYINGPISNGGAVASNNTISGNTISGDNMLIGSESSGGSITGNTFSGDLTYTAIELWGAGTTVDNNDFGLTLPETAFVDAAGNYDEGAILAGSTTTATHAVIGDDQIRLYADEASAEAAGQATDGGVVVDIAAGEINVYDGMSIQDAIDAAQPNQTINVYPGSYSEGGDAGDRPSITGGGEVSLVVSTEGLTIRGVDATGTPITDSGATEATLTLEYQSVWGTFGFIEADGVTISGLGIEATAVDYGTAGMGINKILEVVKDDFTLTNSTMSAASGVWIASAVYFNDQNVVAGTDPNTFVSDIASYLVDGNVLHGSVAVANGPGTGHGTTSMVVSNNLFEANDGVDPETIYYGNVGVTVSGLEDDIAWRNMTATTPEITGNTFAASLSRVLYVADDDPSRVPDLADFQALLANNSVAAYAYATMPGGDLRVVESPSTESGSSAVNYAVRLGTDIGALSAYAQAGDTVVALANGAAPLTPIQTSGLNVDIQPGSDLVTLEMAAGVADLTLVGSEAVDVQGNAEDNTITGNDAANTLLGGDGADTIDGGAGADLLNGEAGDDSLLGGDGDDTLLPSEGRDTIDGGAGTDLFSGRDLTTGLEASLDQAITFLFPGTTGIAAFDDGMGGSHLSGLVNIENLEGSDYDDTLEGSSGDNVIFATSGNDDIDGLGGTDTYDASGGDEITVDLGAGTASGFGIGSDSLTGIENVIGTVGHDTLTGDGADNLLVGGERNDSLTGAGGNDTLDGGFGQDIAAYGADPVTVTHAGGVTTVTSTTEGTDTLIDVDALDLDGTLVHIIADDDSAATDEDTGITPAGSLLDNDFDIAGDALTVVAGDGNALSAGTVTFTTTQGASVTLNSDGTYSYDPSGALDWVNGGESTTDSFTYTVEDVSGNQVTATATIDISGLNDDPTLAVGSQTVAENDTLGVIDLAALGDDLDDEDDGSTLTYTATAAPVGKGTITVNGTDLEFVQGGDFDTLAVGTTDSVSVDVTATDAKGASVTETMTFTVTGVNDDPTLAAGSETLTEDDLGASIDLSALGADVDAGTTLTYSTTGAPVGKGTAAVVGTDLVFTPGSDFDTLAVGGNDTVSVDVTVDDGDGGSATETMTFTVTGVNDDPTLGAGSATLTEDDASATIDLAALGDDIDSDDTGATLTYALTAPYTGPGTVEVNGTDLEFTPGSDFDTLAVGDTDTVSVDVTAEDGNGGTVTETMTFTITGVNDDPTLGAGSAMLTEDDLSSSIDLAALGDDIDSDDTGATLTYALTAPYTGPGTVEVNGTDLDFTPGSDFDTLAVGDTDTVSVDVTAEDGNGGTVTETMTFTITGVNDDPTLGAASETLTEDDASATIDLSALGADVDTGDVLSYTTAGAPVGKGTASVVGTDLVFTPGSDFDSLVGGTSEDVLIDVTVSDGNGGTATETMTFTVNGVNDDPTLAAGTLDADEDGVSVDLDLSTLGDDVDDGEAATLSYSIVSGPAEGGASLTGSTLSFDPGADFQDLSAGDTRDVTVSIEVEDVNGATATNDVTVTVTGVNDDPTLAADALTVTEDVSGSIDLSVLGEDVDSENDGTNLTYSTTGAPAGKGTATVVGTDLVFDPGSDFDSLTSGESEDVLIDVTATDDEGGFVTTTMTVTVTGANDAPVISEIGTFLVPGAAWDGSSITENAANGYTGTANLAYEDVDAPDGATLSTSFALTGPASGDATSLQLALLSSALQTNDPNQPATAGVRNVSYNFALADAALNFLAAGETATATWTVTVTDPHMATDSYDFVVQLIGANDAPVAGADAVSVDEDTPTDVTAALLANDTDQDGDTLSVSAIDTTGTLGTVTLAGGVVTYDGSGAAALLPGETATDSFSYTVSDGNGGFDTETVTVTLNGVADAPEIDGLAPSYTVLENDQQEDATALGPNLTAANADGTGFGTGGLTVSLAGATADDAITLASAPGEALQVFNGVIYYDTVAVGSYSGGAGGVPLSVSFDAGIPDAAVSDVLNAVRVQNSSDTPPAGAREISLELTDADGEVTTQTTDLEITAQDERHLIEYGTTNVSSTGTTITFSQGYVNPVVFATILTANESDPVIAQISGVTGSGFDLMLEETSGSDGIHGIESVSWMVVEEGRWELDDGRILEAGLHETSSQSGGGAATFDAVGFDADFGARPMVLAQTQTNEDADWAITRVKSFNGSEFQVSLQKEEAQITDPFTAPETVGWLAIEEGTGAGIGLESGSTGKTVTEAATEVTLAGGTASSIFASLSTYAGADPAYAGVTGVDGTSFDVNAQEETSANAETNHAAEKVDYVALEGTSGTVAGTDLNTQVIAEFGSAVLDDGIVSVTLEHSFLNPVAFAMSQTNQSDPATVRISEVDGNTLTFSLQEPNHLDGATALEEVTWVVMEAGSWSLSDGTKLEVGSLDSNKLSSEGFEAVTFGSGFDDTPVIVSQVQSFAGNDWVVTRQDNASQAGFDITMQEQEKFNEGGHVSEKLGWFAIEEGTGTWDGHAYEAASVSGVDQNVDSFVFNQSFSEGPNLVGNLGSFNGAQTATLRVDELTASGVDIRALEDTSLDNETFHNDEWVSLFALEGSGLLTGTDLG